MRDGDIIVRVADVPIESFDDLRAVIRARRPGDTVSVVYLRGGQDHSTAATLGAWPTSP
jgi:S1-C subfamily serine protease